jgi:hypothetical protein
MKKFLPYLALVPLLALLPVEAWPADSTPAADPTELAATADVLIIRVDGTPIEVLFVSKKGEVAAIKYATCVQTPDCLALGNALAAAGKADVLNLVTGTKI